FRVISQEGVWVFKRMDKLYEREKLLSLLNDVHFEDDLLSNNITIEKSAFYENQEHFLLVFTSSNAHIICLYENKKCPKGEESYLLKKLPINKKKGKVVD